MIDNEENLIQKAQSGHSDSFGGIYDLHHEKIFRFIYLKVSHKEEAEDLTHQVFLSAWKNIKNYVIKDTPFVSWLYQIARNKVIDHYRSKKNHTPLDSAIENIPDQYNLELITENKIEIEQIKNSLKKLTDEQQDVLIMRFVEDLPIKEVAQSLNKSNGAIKLIQFRAINKLKEILNKNQS